VAQFQQASSNAVEGSAATLIGVGVGNECFDARSGEIVAVAGLPQRRAGQALMRGLRGRCPNCGRGRLFGAFLKSVDRCAICGEVWHHHRADDAPAYFVILITGHIVLPSALAVEIAFAPPYWLHFLLWLPLTLALSVGLLQPVKGAIIAWQWARYMHGFDPHAMPDPTGQDRRVNE
jgi:uncharacterized protein (DUF983 family)